MKLQNEYKVKEAPVLLYAFIRLLITLYTKFVLKLKVKTIDPIPKNGPLFIVCNHGGYFDFLFTAAAVQERRLHFLCADYYFQNKTLGRILRGLGAIPKKQFYPDINSIASMMEVLRRGSAIALFPAGQTSMDGTTTPISNSIARLIQGAGVPVAAIRIQGSYFTHSRFCRGATNIGRVEAEKRMILTAEQTRSLDEETIFQIICEAIEFDDFAWQRDTGVLFHGKQRAQGYENMLVVCPKCGDRYSYQAEGNHVCCISCGNSAQVGENMRFIPETGSSTPQDLQAWIELQREYIVEDISRKDFEMKVEVKVSRYGFEKMGYIGSGIAQMDKQRISFEGQIEEKDISFAVDHAILPGLTGEFGDYFYIPHCDYGALCFHPIQGKSVIEWKLAQEHIRILYVIENQL